MNCVYITDWTEIDFKKMKNEGWQTLKKLPSNSSFQKVLLVTEKHGGDAEVTFGVWEPNDDFNGGKFLTLDKKEIPSTILLWRAINLISSL